MTDKEKIELIIQEKHLNNTQFCNEVCISPGTLSHILSGRTQPTLNILRSITQAFPDINPAWLFYDKEPIYLENDSPTPGEGDADDTYLNSDATEEMVPSEDGQMSLFGFPSASSPATKGSGTNNSQASAAPAAASNAPGSRRSSAFQPASTSLNVQEIVAETLKLQQKPARKVVEVRIFFDDGTFETFRANWKL